MGMESEALGELPPLLKGEVVDSVLEADSGTQPRFTAYN
jgi:hypothetical protein